MKKKTETVNAFDAIVKATRLVLSPAKIEKSKEVVYKSPIFTIYLSKLLENKLLELNGNFQVNIFGKNEIFIISSYQSDQPVTQPKTGLQVTSSTVVEVLLDNCSGAVKSNREEFVSEDYIDFGEHFSKVNNQLTFNLFSSKPPLFPTKGILVSGEKGSGKTFFKCHLAQLMTQKGVSVYSFDAKTFSSDKVIDQALLRDKQPVLVLIDSMDEKTKEMASKLNELFDSMDGVRAMVIAFLRSEHSQSWESFIGPGKFEIDVSVDSPNKNDRKRILELLLRQLVISYKHSERLFKDPSTCNENLPNGFSNRFDEISSLINTDYLESAALKTSGFTIYDLKCLIKEVDMVLFNSISQSKISSKSEAETEVEQIVEALKDFTLKPANIFVKAFSNIGARSLKEFSVAIEKVHYFDIGGYEQVKQRIKAVVELPLKSPELFIKRGIKPSKGILLYGPPGCSKTMFAKAIATEANLNFISIKGPEIFNKYVGSSEKKVREIFKKARYCAPCVIFFDEIDAIASKRDQKSDVSDRILTQLLTEIDGVENPNPLTQSVSKPNSDLIKQNPDDLNKNATETISGASFNNNMVIVIGATNRPEILDPAILRPGRFDELVFVSLPDFHARRAILQLSISKMPIAENVNLEELAEKTEGYSGAEIVQICKEAAMQSIYTQTEASKGLDVVTANDFEYALKKIHKRISRDLLKKFERFEQNDKFLI